MEAVGPMELLTALVIVAVGFAQDEAPEESTAAPEAESTQGPEVTPPGQSPNELLEALEPTPLLEPITGEPAPRLEMPKLWLKYPPGTVFYVDASSLALRTGPKRDAILVHYMPRDSRVVTIEDVIDSVPESVASREGHWIFVRQGEHQGYVFDAFLAQAPPSMLDSLDWLCEPGKRVGPITSKTTVEELMSFFGEGNVREAVIPIGEGKTERGTVIFPEDPERRLFIQWKYHNVSPRSVIVEGTRWRTTKGFGMGSRLSEILRANEGPISFAGFGWEYAGYVMNWRGGALEADHVLRDQISLFLKPEQPYLPADFKAVQGDREFSSDLPEASKLNLHVNAMTIMLDG